MTGHILHSSKLTCSSSSVVHESVMVSHHESGMFFVSFFHLLFWILFLPFLLLSWVFPMGFSTKGVCLESLVKKRVTRSVQAAQHPETQLILTLNGEAWHPTPKGQLAGNIWKNQLAVFVGGCFFKCFFLNLIQLMVNCWFGARWFGILGAPLSITIPFIFGNPRNPNHRAKKQTINYIIYHHWLNSSNPQQIKHWPSY